HLLGVAAGGLGKAAADALHLAFEHVDHGVIRSHVAVLQVAAHGVLHRARRGAHIAVVEVDDIAVDAERGADLAPEVLVGGDFFRGAGSGAAGGGAHAVDGMALEHYGGGELQYMTAVHLEIDYIMDRRRQKMRYPSYCAT